MGCSPWGRDESDTAEQLHFYFSLSCIGEGNGNPLQCSCLENPRDGGAWWAALYGVAQSQTRLKQLSSSSSLYISYSSTEHGEDPHCIFAIIILASHFWGMLSVILLRYGRKICLTRNSFLSQEEKLMYTFFES